MEAAIAGHGAFILKHNERDFPEGLVFNPAGASYTDEEAGMKSVQLRDAVYLRAEYCVGAYGCGLHSPLWRKDTGLTGHNSWDTNG